MNWDLLATLSLSWLIVYLIIWKGLHSSGKVQIFFNLLDSLDRQTGGLVRQISNVEALLLKRAHLQYKVNQCLFVRVSEVLNLADNHWTD